MTPPTPPTPPPVVGTAPDTRNPVSLEGLAPLPKKLKKATAKKASHGATLDTKAAGLEMEKKIAPIIEYWVGAFPATLQIEVRTVDDYERAAGALVQLHTAIKEIDEERLKITRDLDAAKKSLMKQAEDRKAPLETIKARIEQARTVWKHAEDSRQAAEQLAADTRRQAEIAQLATQHHMTPQQVEQYIPPPPPPPPAIPKTVKTASGASVGSRVVPRWRLIDQAKVPWFFEGEVLYKLDDAAIGRLRAKAGRDFTKAPPGIEFYDDTTDTIRGA